MQSSQSVAPIMIKDNSSTICAVDTYENARAIASDFGPALNLIQNDPLKSPPVAAALAAVSKSQASLRLASDTLPDDSSRLEPEDSDSRCCKYFILFLKSLLVVSSSFAFVSAVVIPTLTTVAQLFNIYFGLQSFLLIVQSISALNVILARNRHLSTQIFFLICLINATAVIGLLIFEVPRLTQQLEPSTPSTPLWPTAEPTPPPTTGFESLPTTRYTPTLPTIQPTVIITVTPEFTTRYWDDDITWQYINNTARSLTPTPYLQYYSPTWLQVTEQRVHHHHHQNHWRWQRTRRRDHGRRVSKGDQTDGKYLTIDQERWLRFVAYDLYVLAVLDICSALVACILAVVSPSRPPSRLATSWGRQRQEGVKISASPNVVYLFKSAEPGVQSPPPAGRQQQQQQPQQQQQRQQQQQPQSQAQQMSTTPNEQPDSRNMRYRKFKTIRSPPVPASWRPKRLKSKLLQARLLDRRK